MTDIYWLEQTEIDVPAANDWLSPTELLRLSDLRFAKRRSDWRLGRWTAKRALALCLNIPIDRQALAQIEIRAAPSGEPVVLLDNRRSSSTISLSHSSGSAICAVVPAEVVLGCDLERVESHSDAFVADYFTAEEQALIAGSRAEERCLLLSLVWSAKESALKALHEGLRLPTRSVIVEPSEVSARGEGWHALQVHSDSERFHGWWKQEDDFVRTVVSAPPPNPPIRLLSYPQLLTEPSQKRCGR